MRILLVNKFHYLKGGSEKYYFDLGRLLKENGHQIAFFSMSGMKDIKTGEKEYFVESVDLNSNNKLKALDVIYSKENKKRMQKAIEDFKPDIVHVNNFQRQLSASILDAIKEKNIPIVYTAHDLQAICPAIIMLDSQKKICEECKKGKYSNCIKKKCIKSSTLKSILGAIEGDYYRRKKIYTKRIDRIITPTHFYKEKLVQDGIPEERIEFIPNFIDTEEYQLECQDEGYGLYFGRLATEKGVLNLIEAFGKLKTGKLLIAGDGPEKEVIQEMIEKKHMQDRVQLLGFLNVEEMRERIRKCRFVVVPSMWYENCPYSIMETLAIGKPVIGANIAGIPELVKDSENGLLYEPNNAEELAQKMKRLLEDKELAEKLGKNAKEQAQKLYSKQTYYNKIIKIYESLVKGE